MAIDLSGISNQVGQINNLANLILVTPQKNYGYRAQSKDGKKLDKSILFHIEENNTVSLSSDITNHYVEDNTAVNDHIALQPVKITVRALVGELNNVTPPELEPLKIAKEKLTMVSIYRPAISVSALRAYNIAAQALKVKENVLNNTTSLIESLSGQDTTPVVDSNGITQNFSRSQTLQQVYFQKFYTYWNNRTLFTVQTPWAIFKNCAIQSVNVVQNEETDQISDFEISFQVLRFTKTLFEPKKTSSNLLTYNTINNGNTKGTPGASMASALGLA